MKGLKIWFFILVGAAFVMGGCAIFPKKPVVWPCEGCPSVVDTLWVLQDTLILQTDTIIQENTIELWKLQMLLDSIGSTFAVGQPGDTARIVFVRGKDGVIIRTIIKPITIERIRRDTIRIQIPGPVEKCVKDWAGNLALFGVFGVIIATLLLTIKNRMK
jgi:hypothetical protein